MKPATIDLVIILVYLPATIAIGCHGTLWRLSNASDMFDISGGIACTKDLHAWERLRDLETPSPQQRNLVLHPELVNGRYAFYTRPQDGFINAVTGGGIGFGLCSDITRAVITSESILDSKAYHTE
jgi:hypothetical protein